MTITIGFTGSRNGPTQAQAEALCRVLIGIPPTLWRGVHGDCVGADEAFDRICEELGVYRECRPGDIPHLRAHCKAPMIHLPRSCLLRNAAIVGQCDWLVACPDGPERTRSGTWSTIRKARAVGKPITIVMPDGSMLAGAA